MKKTVLVMAMVTAVLSAAAQAGMRVVEVQPGTNQVATVAITQPSLLQSINCFVSATGQTNSYTITYVGAEDGRTLTLATAIADCINGTATSGKATIFNSDMDTTTLHTEWLRAGDTLKLTGNDATQTAYSNVWYRVVFKTE